MHSLHVEVMTLLSFLGYAWFMVVDYHPIFICAFSQRGRTSAAETAAFEIAIKLLRYFID